MATTGIVEGKNLRVYVNGSAIGYATSFTLNLTTSMIETIHKDSGDNIERAPDQNDWSGTGEYFISFAADGARTLVDNLFTAWNGQTAVTAVFQTEVTGDLTFTGSAYINELSLTGAVGERATGSWGFVGNGALVKATY